MSFFDHIRQLSTPRPDAVALQAAAAMRAHERFERARRLGWDVIAPGSGPNVAYREFCWSFRLPYLVVEMATTTARLHFTWANCKRCLSEPARRVLIETARSGEYAAEGCDVPAVVGSRFELWASDLNPAAVERLAFRITEIAIADGVAMNHDVWGGGQAGPDR